MFTAGAAQAAERSYKFYLYCYTLLVASSQLSETAWRRLPVFKVSKSLVFSLSRKRRNGRKRVPLSFFFFSRPFSRKLYRLFGAPSNLSSFQCTVCIHIWCFFPPFISGPFEVHFGLREGELINVLCTYYCCLSSIC